jgi:hypothetical protein
LNEAIAAGSFQRVTDDFYIQATHNVAVYRV